MIKVIAFDYADVLAEGPISKWKRENPILDNKKLSKYKDNSHKWDIGKMTTSQMYEYLSQLTGIAPQLVWSKIYETTKPNKDIIKLIKILKKEYKIIIFSNFVGEQLRKLLNNFNITNLFDEIIISSEHGLKKPDIKFYKLLVKQSGVKKDEIIFTDDNLENVNAAIKFGIKSFLFTNSKQLIKDLKNEGVRI